MDLTDPFDRLLFSMHLKILFINAFSFFLTLRYVLMHGQAQARFLWHSFTIPTPISH